jgi:hypothetical protein
MQCIRCGSEATRRDGRADCGMLAVDATSVAHPGRTHVAPRQTVVLEPARVLSVAELEARVSASYNCNPEPHLVVSEKAT